MWVSEEDMYWMQMQMMQNAWGCKGKGKGKDKGKGKGKGKSWNSAGGPKNNTTVQADVGFKARLNQACQQKFKAGFNPKTDLTYTTEEEAGPSISYTCAITCEQFSEAYTSAGPAASKNQAEESPAMQAMEGEFPDLFKAAPKAVKKGAEDLEARGSQQAREPRVNNGGSGGTDPKSMLNAGLRILIGRPLVKDDLEYTMQENMGTVQATLSIKCVEDSQTITGTKVQGTSKADRKQAEYNAAEQALQNYQNDIDALMPEHEAKKAAKEAKQEEMFQARKAAREAEGAPDPPAKKQKVKA